MSKEGKVKLERGRGVIEKESGVQISSLARNFWGWGLGLGRG